MKLTHDEIKIILDMFSQVNVPLINAKVYLDLYEKLKNMVATTGTSDNLQK